MKLAFVLLLAFIAGSYAAPKPGVKASGDCDSGYCEALENLYKNIPKYLDGMENQVCQAVSEIFPDSFRQFLNQLCHEFINQEKGPIIAQIRQQIKQQGGADDCDFGGSKAGTARDDDDCDHSPYCEALENVYKNMPNYIGSMINQICDMLPTSFEGFCKQLADSLKAELVAGFRQQIKQQAQEFGCDDIGSK
uniref:Uncharacterized protein n=1 Tax=Plectus sambesii TaxID=2011161 RepID=A0A914VZ72_9BILA